MPAMWLDVDVALTEVPINSVALIDDTDFKTREESVTYNQVGLDLLWNFVTSAGVYTQTAVTPTDTGGDYDWLNQGNGMYSIEIPASDGASINNDTEGYGWFTGFATGILPWSGPIIGFRAAGLNDKLTDSAYSTTRGLGGIALPAAAADAAGGLPISDAGGLDLDSKLSDIIGAGYIGDYKVDETVAFTWKSGQVTASGGSIKVYKDANTSEVTVPTGVTEYIDFDSITGNHRVEIELNANSFYAKRSDYTVVRDNVIIHGQTITLVIAEFSIQNRYEHIPFRPGG